VTTDYCETTAAAAATSGATRPLWTVILAFAIIALLVLAVVAAPLIAPHDPDAVDIALRLRPPDAVHWLGTDHLGRDVFSRLIHGARVSLGAVALISVLVLALGLAVGGLAGFVGGRVDQVVMRVCDVFLTFPTFVLAMFMVGVLGTGMTNVVLAIVLSHWAWYARIVRSLTLSVAGRDYIRAARVAGASDLTIFREHVLPGVLAQVLVLTTLDIGHMMLHVSGLSFLGLGIAPPTAEWGVMINDARDFVWTQPLLIAWPGLAVFLTVMAFNRIGDALRDKLDPAIAAECC
jgi:nickel transport system permease protein